MQHSTVRYTVQYSAIQSGNSAAQQNTVQYSSVLYPKQLKQRDGWGVPLQNLEYSTESSLRMASHESAELDGRRAFQMASR